MTEHRPPVNVVVTDTSGSQTRFVTQAYAEQLREDLRAVRFERDSTKDYADRLTKDVDQLRADLRQAQDARTVMPSRHCGLLAHHPEHTWGGTANGVGPQLFTCTGQGINQDEFPNKFLFRVVRPNIGTAIVIATNSLEAMDLVADAVENRRRYVYAWDIDHVTVTLLSACDGMNPQVLAIEFNSRQK